MDLAPFTSRSLAEYTATQLATLIPDRSPSSGPCLLRHIDETLSRLERCIDAVKTWPQGKFNHLHSSQYCTYLYFLSNTIWRREPDNESVCTRLFLLNKALNAIDLFYEIAMPEVFFIGHSVGIVLAKATYGNHLVLYQNSTVGKNHGVAPALGEGVILYPNSAIIGRCRIGDRTTISQGTSVINRDTPGDCMVFQRNGSLFIKENKRLIIEDFFRAPG